jgi:glycerol-3-phosphate dehydrogenase
VLDVVVIGCGIVGAAAAYELSKYRLSTAVLDKENDVADGVTKANSAIIHAGYDPEPGTLMASLNVAGHRLAGELCKKLDVPHRQCGSLVLAFSEEDRRLLSHLYDQGIRNGVTAMELLKGAQVRALEPNLSDSVCGALLAPGAMIVSPWEYALALIETALRNGVKLYLNNEVKTISPEGSHWRITTDQGVFETRFIINAAGVHSDRIHNMAAPPEFTIFPKRGEYYILDKSEGNRVNHIIFQCPTKNGKGVVVAPTVHGNLLAGPNNEIPRDNEDTATTAKGLAEVAAAARRSLPALNLQAGIRNFSGIRAATDEKDFIVREAQGAPGFFDLAGIQSPGLSAAPAIAALALELLRDRGLGGEPKEEFIDTRRRVRFAELSPKEKAALIKNNPAYGQVLCRCETVTEGEILDALRSPIPPRTLDAVKRRCNPGMGRCQGGFCGPRIMELLADHFNTDPSAILQDKRGTFILTGTTGGTGKVKEEASYAV